jgi:hypothetical protein
MFKQMLLTLAIKAFHAAICQFYGYCLEDENCPDGVCDDALDALDSLDADTPQPVVKPGVTQSFDFAIDWEQLKPLVDATVLFVTTLKAFLGLSPKVG